jgi:2-keto-4-pentenoate hydratase/2-oxohepta-3-ene-1,7-dioic acid hydratase in catechol pathway
VFKVTQKSMKIIAVGRNYVDHILELQNEKPSEPVIFTKPETAILRNNEPFYLPDFSSDIHHEVEVIVRISKIGKNIDPAFAHKYYDEIGVGIDFTARDIQSNLKAKGLPWELAKAFDGSAPISSFIPKSTFASMQDISFDLHVNGELKQAGNTSLMLYSIDFLIAHVSKYFTLKVGDILFTGTPKGVGPVKIGDELVARLGDQEMLRFSVK